MLARNRFLHWPTALSFTFCYMLAHVSMWRYFKSLVTAAGVANRWLYSVHTFIHQSTKQTVCRTQIWRGKFRCFLLRSWTVLRAQSDVRTSHFRHSYLKANKISKSEWTRSWTRTSFLKVCWCRLPKIIKINQCLSKLQHAKVGAFFWDTVYIYSTYIHCVQ